MAGILNQKADANSKPILFGKDIARYYYKWSGKYVEYEETNCCVPVMKGFS
jgi:hypothetical protein